MPHKILVLGGSGPTGRLIVAQALEQGHTVTVLARRPEAVGITKARLVLIAGDAASDPASVTRALHGHDVVISALGRGLSFKPENLMTRATPAIVSAMESGGVKRLVFISGLGVDGKAPDAPLLDRLFWRFPLAGIYADKAVAEQIITSTTLDWTIVAPVRLTNGARSGQFRLVEGRVSRGPWTMSRPDAAAATLRCVDDPSTIRKRLVAQ